MQLCFRLKYTCYVNTFGLKWQQSGHDFEVCVLGAQQGQQNWDQAQEFEDIFSQFFGGGGAYARGGAAGGFGGGFGGFRAKGPDMHARIRCAALSLMDVSGIAAEQRYRAEASHKKGFTSLTGEGPKLTGLNWLRGGVVHTTVHALSTLPSATIALFTGCSPASLGRLEF